MPPEMNIRKDFNAFKLDSMIKSSASQQPVAVVSQSEKLNLLNSILDSQTSEGLWKTDPVQMIRDIKNTFHFKNLDIDGLRGEVDKITKDKSMIESIIATIIALWILADKYESQEDEWQLIAKKARTALKAHGIIKVDNFFTFIITD